MTWDGKGDCGHLQPGAGVCLECRTERRKLMGGRARTLREQAKLTPTNRLCYLIKLYAEELQRRLEDK